MPYAKECPYLCKQNAMIKGKEQKSKNLNVAHVVSGLGPDAIRRVQVRIINQKESEKHEELV